jgi:hypothetical protein
MAKVSFVEGDQLVGEVAPAKVIALTLEMLFLCNEQVTVHRDPAGIVELLLIGLGLRLYGADVAEIGLALVRTANPEPRGGVSLELVTASEKAFDTGTNLGLPIKNGSIVALEKRDKIVMIRELVYRIFVAISRQHFLKVPKSRVLAGPRPPVLQYDRLRLRHSSSFLRVIAP